MRSRFLPEGRLLHTPENEAACASCDGLRRAMEEGTVLEGVAQLCDGAHNLLVSVGPFTGFLPREEAALGIAEGIFILYFGNLYMMIQQDVLGYLIFIIQNTPKIFLIFYNLLICQSLNRKRIPVFPNSK